MKYYKINPIPKILKNRAVPAPKTLYATSPNLDEFLAMKRVAIVGSRKPSAYGRSITYNIATELCRQNVLIVSGLALGIDSIAHQAAVDNNRPTIAVLPSSINNVYPRSHTALSKKIILAGGALVSEYENTDQINKYQFIARNRLIAALSTIVVITEAAEKSGSLHTAQFAIDQGIDVMAVPGEITSSLSKGTNELIKNGAGIITGADDILQALGITKTKRQQNLVNHQLDATQKKILKIMVSGVTEGNELLKQSGLSPGQFQESMTILEINELVQSRGINSWVIP